MHGFRWPVRGMVDSHIFMEKNELPDLISAGSTILLCACLFADIASLLPHVATHMKHWGTVYENLVHRWFT